MRIRVLALLIGICIYHSGSAQIYNPVKWAFTSQHVSDDQYLLVFEATIEPNWAVYSQYLESDEGPVATSITFEQTEAIELIGNAKESGHKKEGFDALFEMNVIKFFDEFRIEQLVKYRGNVPVTGYLNYMTCDDTRCLPPADVDFSFNLKSEAKSQGGMDQEDQGQEDGAAANAEFADDLVIKTDDIGIAGLEDDGIERQDLVEPVKWSANYQLKEGKPYVTFKAVIDEGWHIYGQEIDGDGPIPTAFLIGDEKTILPAETPHARTEADEFFEGLVIKKIKKEASFSLAVEGVEVIEGEIEYMSCNDTQCTFPAPLPFKIDPQQSQVVLGSEVYTSQGVKAEERDYAISAEAVSTPVGTCGHQHEIKSKGLWGIFFLGFVGGLVALLTPCVFPMIPLTVSFFTKGSENRRKGIQRAFWYGAFILLVYLILSIPFHLLDSVNPGILNEISTNVFLNIFFFLIFLFFAFSFFGYYEITLPSSWTNKASSAEGIGGILGIFFMALTLALVSFSCTGPILGTLLAGALTSDGGAIQLTAGMGGFGLALALPFALFAAFPAWLSTLPKSGGWLNTVKVTLGFIELALAFKFLSNADLVKRWGLLKIEPFLVIWILIFLGLAIYLFGKLRFPHDSPIKKLSFLRVSTGILSLAFAIYLGSGFMVNQDTRTFKSLKLLSGLAPPSGYSWLHPNDCPNDLDCFKDLEKGLSHAKKVGKPIMIDFTGHACVNCRKMEEHVWPQKPVIDRLKEDYVLISLYVDEKIPLPEEDQIVVKKKTGNMQKLRTYGNKWEHFQSEYFNNNSQPYYVLLSPDGQLLNHPVGYTPDVEEYAAFLDCGLNVFQEMQSTIGAR